MVAEMQGRAHLLHRIEILEAAADRGEDLARKLWAQYFEDCTAMSAGPLFLVRRTRETW